MKTLISVVLILCGIVFCSSVRAADEPAATAPTSKIDPTLEKEIRKLLELSGSGKLAEQMMNQMIAVFSGQHPEVPQEFWSNFRDQAKADDFVELIVPIYASHFTADEIKDLIKFYQSPIGQKLVKEQPKMMTESMQVGQQWGARLGAKIVEQLRNKGYIKA